MPRLEEDEDDNGGDVLVVLVLVAFTVNPVEDIDDDEGEHWSVEDGATLVESVDFFDDEGDGESVNSFVDTIADSFDNVDVNVWCWQSPFGDSDCNTNDDRFRLSSWFVSDTLFWSVRALFVFWLAFPVIDWFSSSTLLQLLLSCGCILNDDDDVDDDDDRVEVGKQSHVFALVVVTVLLDEFEFEIEVLLLLLPPLLWRILPVLDDCVDEDDDESSNMVEWWLTLFDDNDGE